MSWDNGTDDLLNNRLTVSWTTLGETFSKAGDLTFNQNKETVKHIWKMSYNLHKISHSGQQQQQQQQALS